MKQRDNGNIGDLRRFGHSDGIGGLNDFAGQSSAYLDRAIRQQVGEKVFE